MAKITRTYYTLEEMFKIIGFEDEDEYIAKMQMGIEISNLYKQIVEAIFGYEFPESSTSPLVTDEVNKLFMLFFVKYMRNIVYYNDKGDADLNDATIFFSWFNAIVMDSYDKYARLIKNLEASEDELLNSKTVTTNKFMDTPQTNIDSLLDDKHLSTYSVNETNQNPDVVAKLAEIDELLKSYYSEWLKEFGGLVMYD